MRCVRLILALAFSIIAVETTYLALMVQDRRVNSEASKVSQIEPEIVTPYVNLETGAGTVVELKGQFYVLTARHVAQELFASFEQVRSYKFQGQTRRVVLDRWVDVEPEEKPNRRKRPEKCDMALLKIVDQDGCVAAVLAPRGTKLYHGETSIHVGTAWSFPQRLDRGSIDRPDFEALGNLWNLHSGHGWFGSSGGALYVWRSGHWVLAGVTNRITEAHPGACLMARQTDVMLDFLEDR